MVLKELKIYARLGLKAAGMKHSDIEKHLAPLVKAGKITKKEATSFAKDIISVGQKHHDRITKAVAKELEKGLKKRGYVKVKASKKKSTKKRFTKKPVKKKVVKRKPAKRRATKKK